MTRRTARSLTALALAAAALGSALALSRSDYSFFDPVIEVKDIINRRYVEKPDEKALQLGAINGLVGALNDPYTTYVPPTNRREFDKELTGEYVGIGVVVESRDGWLTVVSPMEDSAAAKAGIVADDRIVEVEGASTFRLTPDQCVELLAGKSGEPVKIVVERAGQKLPLSVIREDVVVRTVKGFHWGGGNGAPDAGPVRWQYLLDPQRRIGYIRLTQFTPSSADDLREALAALGAPEGKLGGLILDLRFNPGGVLDGAISIADMFLKEGLIVSTRGRSFPEETARAKPEGTLPDFPLAVIVNGQSASASEVLSGALQDNNRAVVIGTRSFGKGLVQTVLPVPGVPGAQLKVTQQRYYLPSGRCIQRTDDSAQWGVDPSPGFYVPLTDQETADMLRTRRTEDILKAPSAGGADWSNPDAIVEHLKDKQLAAAVKAVQVRIDSGAWKPTGTESPPGAEVAAKELSKAELLRDRMERELEKLDKKIESLQALSPAAADATARDLWPDTADPVGGRVVVTDKDGNVIARLKVNGEGLERWLIESPVEPEKEK